MRGGGGTQARRGTEVVVARVARSIERLGLTCRPARRQRLASGSGGQTVFEPDLKFKRIQIPFKSLQTLPD
jgi:hypothetical protein